MHGRMLRSGFPILLSLLDASVGFGLATRPADTELCDAAAESAARNNAVPLDILRAITRVETGRRRDGESQPWPWAINQNGQGHWFADAAEAIAFGNAQLVAGDENFDVGCFQINLHWHGAHFASLDAAFDPQTNADFAAEFLLQLFNSEGSWEKAIAAYHSRTPDQAASYLTAVQAVMADLPDGGQDAAAAQFAPPVEAAPRVNTFPLLLAGMHGNGASLVPETDGGTPLFAAVP